MVRKLILASALILSSQAARAEVGCKAIHEWLNSNDKLEHVEIPLKATFRAPDMLVLEGDLDGRNFSLRGNPKGEEFLIFITEGPDYRKGIVTNSSFNGSGELRVSSVDGTVVHKLVCKR